MEFCDGTVDLNLDWNNDVSNPWIQDAVTRFRWFWIFIESPSLAQGSTSSFSTTIDTFGGNVSFWFKTSTDPSDKLQFLIDGNLVNEWSGTSNTWAKNTTSFGSGEHITRLQL